MTKGLDKGNLTSYTLEELATRDGKQKPEIWIAYMGIVYDVSTSKLFIEGRHFFLRAGEDLTEEMSNAPHAEEVLRKFPPVGKLII